MATPVVAVLGTGTMGAGMVRSLRRADLPVRVWNRDAGKARALTDTGAEAFDSPDEAVAGADVVLTMLLDADAVLDVVRQASPAAGTVWLQTSTVGLEDADAGRGPVPGRSRPPSARPSSSDSPSVQGESEGALSQPAMVWRSGSIQTMTRSLLMFSAG